MIWFIRNWTPENKLQWNLNENKNILLLLILFKITFLHENCCILFQISKTTPRHYVDQCWLIISKVLCYWSEGNFTGNAPHIYPWCEYFWLKIIATFPRGLRVNHERASMHMKLLYKQYSIIFIGQMPWQKVVLVSASSVPCRHGYLFLTKTYVFSSWGQVTHIYVIKLSHYYFRKWLVAWVAPSHYLK